MKIEHEKMNIEKEKVVLETKVKHIGEQSEIQLHVCWKVLFKHMDMSISAEQYIEQELQQLKEKASRDEQTRQEVSTQHLLSLSLSLSLFPLIITDSHVQTHTPTHQLLEQYKRQTESVRSASLQRRYHINTNDIT